MCTPATSVPIARRGCSRVASPTLDVGEWLGIIGALVAVVGGLVGWIHQRINLVEGEMKEWAKLNAAQDVQLERLKTCGENTAATLAEIKETAIKVNDKLDAVLLAIQK